MVLSLAAIGVSAAALAGSAAGKLWSQAKTVSRTVSGIVHGNRTHRQALLGQMRAQSGHMATERLCGICCAWNDRRMNAARAHLRANRHPAQCRILKSSLCLMRA